MANLFERMRMQMAADDASTMMALLHRLKKEMLAAQEKAAVAEARADAAEGKAAAAEGKAAAAEVKAEAAEVKAEAADKRAIKILEASKGSIDSLHEAWLNGGRQLISQRERIDKDAAGDVFRVKPQPYEEWSVYQQRMKTGHILTTDDALKRKVAEDRSEENVIRTRERMERQERMKMSKEDNRHGK